MFQDEELLKLLDKKPEKGLEMLMNSYNGLVYTIAYNNLYNFVSKEDIEECVSDIIYEIYKNRRNIDLTKGSIKSFISVISKRRSIDLLRKVNKKKNDISIEGMEYEDIRSENLTIEDKIVNNETKNYLINSIKSLGEPDSEIMIRKYYFGESTKEISKILKIKQNTIDKKVSRVLSKLKNFLEEVL